MPISLVSPLNLKECIARLEEAQKREVVSFSREFIPPRCEVKGKTFTLRKNFGKYVPFLHGELTESLDGTIITYSMKIDSMTNRFSSLWLAIGIPVILCFVLAVVLEGFTKGFSWNLMFALLMAIAILGLYYFQRQFGICRSEIDKKEMLEFLQKTLDAKPRLP